MVNRTTSLQPVAAVPEAFHELAEYAMLASQPDPFDPMDRAIRKLGDEALRGTGHLHGNWKVVREYPLSKNLLAISEVWSSPDGARRVIAAKGAPEAIVDLCHFRQAMPRRSMSGCPKWRRRDSVCSAWPRRGSPPLSFPIGNTISNFNSLA